MQKDFSEIVKNCRLIIHWDQCSCDGIASNFPKETEYSKKYLIGKRRICVRKVKKNTWLCVFRIYDSWKSSIETISTNIKNIRTAAFFCKIGNCKCETENKDIIAYFSKLCPNIKISLWKEHLSPLERTEKYGERSFKEYTYENVPSGWEDFFNENNYVIEDISDSLDKCKEPIYPPLGLVYYAFELCKPQEIKVVLIGQDPYHKPGEAMGLAFSVPQGIRIPPSLRNIYYSLKKENYEISDISCGDLTGWVKKGVFLINTALTVKERTPGSHSKIWKSFTTRLVIWLNENMKGIVWVLWGGPAQSYSKFIDSKKHRIVENIHPSGFNTAKWKQTTPFTNINKAFESLDKSPINWNL